MNGYTLSRNWFDFCFDNPDLIKPNHTALYFFCIEHCNRLGWKNKYGLPTTMAKEAIGIRSYNTYINTLNDLVDWKFIEMVERSKNQYSSNIIALSNFDKAHDKALDKAIVKHVIKQGESIDSIDKPINKETNKPKNKFTPPLINEVAQYFIDNGYTEKSAINAFKYYEEGDWKDSKGNKVKNWKQKMRGVWFKDENKKPIENKLTGKYGHKF